MDHGTVIAIVEARPQASSSPAEQKSVGVDAHRKTASADTELDRHIALVEPRTFIRECMHRGMQAALSLPIVTFSTVSEFESRFSDSVALVFLCLTDVRPAECVHALRVLSALDPSVPIVVCAVNDMELAKTAINFGAKGFIPVTTSFEIAIGVVQFILAGGTYFPADYLFAFEPNGPSATVASPPPDALTERESSVVQAIQQGKSNKIIACQLSISESTVKVHVRNFMKKMNAKNRTEVAVTAQTSLAMDIEGPIAGLQRLSR